ncbi:hypothetical protein HFN76_10465 [Rhizobium laguerreae]|uniref:hypothetical protein n=1 Tax=Rhizobium laguerreae TaxID=1076926 RepID=UPI001C90685E|nr:hypothetical protein [Rhizobium laguerreae]MBY3512663.1 hypothetical protein [Rhizobium laguerreae]
MSDGPHKSLPLRPKYKRMAERAYKPAFSIADVCEAAEAALMRDAVIELKEAVGQLRAIVDGTDLFSRQPQLQNRRLQEKRDASAGHPLAASVIECTQMAIRDGLEGQRALEVGIATALSERLTANGRTSEEHYLAERGQRACSVIRNRMSEVNAAMDASGAFARMARSIVGDSNVSVIRAPAVRDGLDEGVSLR